MSLPATFDRAAREHVRWHDLECGRYAADLPLWEELASVPGTTVRDLGAGTGRVTLALAERGHRVEAVDHDPVLLRALAARAKERGLDDRVRLVLGDVREPLRRAVQLVLAPMQTVQLLGGADGRRAMLRAAAADLAAGGLVAIAVAESVEPFVPEDGGGTPVPDIAEWGGTVYASRPVAVRPTATGWDLERVREIVEPDGTRTRTDDVTPLDRCTAAGLEAEAMAVGLRPVGRRDVVETDDHVGSVVVLLRAAHGVGR